MNQIIEYIMERMSSKYKRFSMMDIEQIALFPSGCFTIDGKDFREVYNSKDILSFCKEDVFKMQMNNALDKTVMSKEKLYDLYKDFPEDVNRRLKFVVSNTKKITSSIKDLIPVELDEKDRENANQIRNISLVLAAGVDVCKTIIEHMLDKYPKDKEGQTLIRYAIVKALVDLNYFSMTGIYLHQEAYEYFYGPKDKKEETADMINQIKDAVYASLAPSLDSIKNETKQAVNHSKNNAKALESIAKNQKHTDDRIIRKGNKIIETVKKTKKESRCELTQMDCARIIAEERRNTYKAKKHILIALKMSTETIDKDKDPDEENLVRTIERWDTGETKPPVGYSRRISEYEFKEWVKKREKLKLDRWVIRIRRNLKNVSIESVPEAVLDDWLRVNNGNNNDNQ